MDAVGRIAALREADTGLRVFGARHHRWTLAPAWSTEQLARFERLKRVELPASYRRWLLNVGSSGAGPGNGLFEPGTIDTGGGPKKWSGRRFGPLRSAFPYDSAVDVHKGKLPGALPLCDLGCGVVTVLVTAGPQRGRVWVDDRNSRAGLHSEGDLDFEGWIEAWLSESEREVRDPWVPAPKHPNKPDSLRPATEVVGLEALEAWVASVRSELAIRGRAQLPGRLGAFQKRQRSFVFAQGPALGRLLAGEALKEKGVAADLFTALSSWPPWTGVEVPGLFQAWVREDRRGERRDYLGRPSYFGQEGLFLTVFTSVRPEDLAPGA